MNVLVAYATRHGATAGIAERIAATLRAEGLSAEARSVGEVGDLGSFDRPVWLFSSGPLGTEAVDKDGADILEATRPKEFEELTTLLHPRDERVFFGAFDPDAPPATLGERLLRLMPASREATPAGDFRDWPAIDAWATEIAADLKGAGQ